MRDIRTEEVMLLDAGGARCYRGHPVLKIEPGLKGFDHYCPTCRALVRLEGEVENGTGRNWKPGAYYVVELVTRGNRLLNEGIGRVGVDGAAGRDQGAHRGQAHSS